MIDNGRLVLTQYSEVVLTSTERPEGDWKYRILEIKENDPWFMFAYISFEKRNNSTFSSTRK